MVVVGSVVRLVNVVAWPGHTGVDRVGAAKVTAMSKPALIAKLTCQDGKRDEFVAMARKMIDYVQASEPGTEVYALHTDDKDPNVAWFYELYTDGDALKTHGGSEMMAKIGAEFATVLAGRAELFRLTPVAGKGIAL